jgi:mannose-6-phosphate isomerase
MSTAQSRLAPFRLSPWFSPRPWGSRSLLPWFDLTVPERCEPIGEAWLTSKDCVIESGPHRGHTLGRLETLHPRELLGAAAGDPDYPLLLKFIFPKEKLSVQVHPDDTMARAQGLPRGKSECWYCVESKPGGAVALGLKPGVTDKAVREAIKEKTLEQLLEWLPVSAGDMIFVDAGTVHAIAPGVVLLETQQQSDVTYRLYDYGRPRELHVDLALQAMRLTTEAGKVKPQVVSAKGKPGTNGQQKSNGHNAEATRLIHQRYFTVDRYELPAGGTVTLAAADVPLTLIALTGDVTLHSPGNEPVMLGHCQGVVVPPQAPGDRCELRARQDGGEATIICATPGVVTPQAS